MGNKKVKTKDTIKYSGNVNITVVKGGKTVKTSTKHNTAFLLLLQQIASSICGNNQREYMPNYIDGGIKTSGSFVSKFTNKVMLTNKYYVKKREQNVDFYEVSFTAYIPYSIVGANTIKALRLYSDGNLESSNVLAEVDLDEEDWITLTDASYNIMIEWKMNITQ